MAGQGKGMRSAAVWVSAVATVLLVSCTRGSWATTFEVGDSKGWTIPAASNGNVNYTNWADEYSYVVGDTLHFTYPSTQHNVLPLPDADSFANCDATKATVPALDSGSDDITLKAAGTHWYICAVPGHCTAGMKVAVNVQALPTPAPSPSGGANAAPIALVRRAAVLAVVTLLLASLF